MEKLRSTFPDSKRFSIVFDRLYNIINFKVDSPTPSRGRGTQLLVLSAFPETGDISFGRAIARPFHFRKLFHEFSNNAICSAHSFLFCDWRALELCSLLISPSLFAPFGLLFPRTSTFPSFAGNRCYRKRVCPSASPVGLFAPRRPSAPILHRSSTLGPRTCLPSHNNGIENCGLG